MPGPEFNPRDDEQPTQEEWEAYERERDALLIPNQPATDVLLEQKPITVEHFKKIEAQYRKAWNAVFEVDRVMGYGPTLEALCQYIKDSSGFLLTSHETLRTQNERLLTTLAARDAEIERLEAEHLERDETEAADEMLNNHEEWCYRFAPDDPDALQKLTAIFTRKRLAQRKP